MKKLVSLMGAGVVLLAVAAPALAWGSKDVAVVNNSATAISTTGSNGVGNLGYVEKAHGGNVTVSGNNSLVTGDATSYAGALVVANAHIGCGPCASGGKHHTDVAIIKDNSALALSDTGSNGVGNLGYVEKAHGGNVTVSGNNDVTTGAADSTARAWTLVNIHWGGSYD